MIRYGSLVNEWVRMYTQAMSRHSAFRARAVAATLLLSLCNMVFVGSGFGCARPSSTSSMSMAEMSMAGTVTGSEQHHDRQRGGCQPPWAPGGCRTMAPCAPVALKSGALTLVANAATPEATPVFTVIAPRSISRAPELPPPRA
jgi:hypothetical protein